MKTKDKIEVIWNDAFNQNGWWEIKEILAKIKQRTENPTNSVGYYVCEDKNWLVLGMSDANAVDGDLVNWGCWKAIPKKWILKIKKLK